MRPLPFVFQRESYRNDPAEQRSALMAWFDAKPASDELQGLRSKTIDSTVTNATFRVTVISTVSP